MSAGCSMTLHTTRDSAFRNEDMSSSLKMAGLYSPSIRPWLTQRALFKKGTDVIQEYSIYIYNKKRTFLIEITHYFFRERFFSKNSLNET